MIRSRHNSRLRDLRRLRRDRRWRESRSEALLEGPHLIEAALEAGLAPTATFATAAFLEAAPAIVERLPAPPFEVDESLLDELADADSPRGIVATVPLRTARLDDWIASADRDAHRDRPVIAIDRLQDPGNLGALARVAEAAGAMLLALAPGTVDWRHPRALRASTGSLLRLPVVESMTLPALRCALSTLDPVWLGLSPRGGVSLWEPNALPLRRVVLVVGSESEGLSAEAEATIDGTVTIPMAPPVESINVTAAAAVVLFELARRRA